MRKLHDLQRSHDEILTPIHLTIEMVLLSTMSVPMNLGNFQFA